MRPYQKARKELSVIRGQDWIPVLPIGAFSSGNAEAYMILHNSTEHTLLSRKRSTGRLKWGGILLTCFFTNLEIS